MDIEVDTSKLEFAKEHPWHLYLSAGLAPLLQSLNPEPTLWVTAFVVFCALVGVGLLYFQDSRVRRLNKCVILIEVLKKLDDQYKAAQGAEKDAIGHVYNAMWGEYHKLKFWKDNENGEKS